MLNGYSFRLASNRLAALTVKTESARGDMMPSVMAIAVAKQMGLRARSEGNHSQSNHQ